MIGGDGGGIAARLASQVDVANNAQIRGLVEAMATLERNRRTALAAHFDAAGVDVDLPALPDHEERVDELLALIEARIAGDPWDYWVEYQAPDALENVEQARQYAGLDGEEWSEKVDQWADTYRERFDTDGVSDCDLAGYHVDSQFGLSLDEFEDVVVEWNPAEVLERAATGPQQDMTAAVVEATEQLQEDGEA